MNECQMNIQRRRKKGREEGTKEGRVRVRYSPREELSRPGGPIRPFSFLPKRRPMDDLMLFFLGALCRESGVPSLGKKERMRAYPGWAASSPLLPSPCPPPSHLPKPASPCPYPLSLLTFPVRVPHLPGTPPAVPRPGSFFQDGQSGEWVAGCLLGWPAPPLVELQLPP